MGWVEGHSEGGEGKGEWSMAVGDMYVHMHRDGDISIRKGGR